MTQFVFNTCPMEASCWGNGQWGVSLSIMEDVPECPSCIVEAKNVKELLPIFERFCAKAEATGIPMHVSVMMRNRHDRKPAGFDKARESGGPLRRDILWERAKEITLAKIAAQAKIGADAAKIAAGWAA